MDRRKFTLGMSGIFAAGVAPAFVRAGSLMPVRQIEVVDYSALLVDCLEQRTREFAESIRCQFTTALFNESGMARLHVTEFADWRDSQGLPKGHNPFWSS